MTIRTYSELSRLATFEERFDYLRLSGGVGRSTFGFDRHINQTFYRSSEWQELRHRIIVRDEGCDLGVAGYEIQVDPLIHHMNPMSVNEILQHDDHILDPEFLILTSFRTHNDIHFGKRSPYPKTVLQRTPRDTTLW